MYSLKVQSITRLLLNFAELIEVLVGKRNISSRRLQICDPLQGNRGKKCGSRSRPFVYFNASSFDTRVCCALSYQLTGYVRYKVLDLQISKG